MVPIEATCLRQQLFHDACSRIGVDQRLGRGIASKREPLRIESKEVQQRRVVIVLRDDSFNGAMSEFVRRAVGVATFEAATGKPRREAVGIVIATDAIRSGVVLDDRQSSHFAAPMHDRRIEQPALFEVFGQCRTRLVDPQAGLRQSSAQRSMMISHLSVRVDGDESNPPFDQPSREQAACAKIASLVVVEPIQLLSRLGLLRQIQRFFGRRLHSSR